MKTSILVAVSGSADPERLVEVVRGLPGNGAGNEPGIVRVDPDGDGDPLQEAIDAHMGASDRSPWIVIAASADRHYLHFAWEDHEVVTAADVVAAVAASLDGERRSASPPVVVRPHRPRSPGTLLPHDRAPEHHAPGPVREVPVPVDPAELDDLCRLVEAEPPVVVAAALATLAQRYSGDGSIPVDLVTLDTEGRVATEDLVVSVSPSTGFRKLTGAVRAPHPPVEADGARDANLRVRALPSVVTSGGTTVELLHSRPAQAMVDLEAILAPSGGIQLGFDTARFDEETARRIAGHLAAVLIRARREPDAPVASYDILSDAERRRLVDRQPDPSDTEPATTLHERFAEMARIHPDGVAIRFSGEETTFAELAAGVGRLTHALVGSGLRPGQRVALMFETGPPLVTTMLATLAAGGVMVCLDPTYPAARLEVMLGEAEPAMVVADGASVDAHGSLIPDGVLKLLLGPEARSGWLTLDEAALARQPDELPGVEVEPSDPCYIVYTSGSTGVPKGIVQTHRAFSQFVSWQSRELNIGPGDIWAQWASTAYDASYCEIFGALCFGATLALADGSVRYNPVALVDWVARENATILQVVPSFAREVVEVLERPGHGPGSGLRLVMLAGERLPVDLARRWLAVSDGPLDVYNLYGPSETVLATHHRVSAADLERPSIPIGRAIDGRQILILDPLGRPAPIGVRGELYVRSAFLTQGYYRNDAETKERFIANPITGDPEDRVYRTGDIARWLPDGILEFFGREDNLVKLRGVRVELGDVEAALRSYPDVREAAAVVRTVQTPRRMLVAKEWEARTAEADEIQVLAAYFTADDTVDRSNLRRHLRDRLPVHMVPQHLVQLDSLPRNANRKIDIRRLPAIDAMHIERSTEFVAPRTATEAAVAAVWSEILRVPEVGAEDGFFELGGDSLLAMRTLDRLRGETGAMLSFRDLFTYRTVAELAAALDEQAGAGDAPAVVEGVVRTDGSHPLSLAQQGIWFLWRLEPDSPYYTAQGSIRFEGRLDIAVLRRAWSAVLDRHQVLRSRYLLEKGEPVQRFRTDMPTDLPLVDVSDAPLDERRKRMIDRSRSHVRALDLERDPLISGELFKFDEDVHELAITFHEIVLDLWGLSLLMRDLHRMYRLLLGGGSVEAAPPAAGFGDYVDWEHERLTRENLDGQAAYWQEHLAGELPVLALPTDHPRPAAPSYRGAAESLFIGDELTEALRELSRSHGTTLFATLLASFNVLLGAYSGQDDVIVGAPLANRTHGTSSEVVGFFLNMLPLRTSLDPETSFADLLDQSRQTVVGALSNADYPFPWMLETVRIPRDRSVSPVFQVMFNMLNLPHEAIEDDELAITFSELDSGYVKYDLSLYAQEHGERLFLQFAYLTDLFEPATVRRMLDNFEVLLGDVVADPSRRLRELRVTSEGERVHLLERFNDTDVDYGIDSTIQARFEETAASRPDAVAYRFGGDVIRYRDLNARANRLAHHLRHVGVGPEVRVGLCLERGFDMVVALLGVLKAGGAYVALDPEYPTQRLEHILEDAACPVLVVEADLDRFPGYAGTKVRIGEVDLAGYPDTNPSPVGDPKSAAAVIYTSSTTGRPKGVVIDQRAVLNRLEWMWREYPFGEGDVAVIQKSYALVAATWEFFGALIAGVPTLVLSVDDVRDPVRLWEACVANGVSYFLGVPALLEGILLEAERRGGGWPTLRLATTSAEPIAPAMVERWRRWFPDVPLLNLYGATECASNALGYDTGRMPAGSVRVPIGTPLPNVRAYVLDGALRPVPWGATGELCVSGDCLARGYIGLGELSAERFVPDPFRPGRRLYRTGDLARMRHDGAMELLGRSDLQVKVRGFRVELNDVESSLLEHPAVRRCAVILDDTVPEMPRLVALVEVDSEVASADLRAHVADRLPTYMVPGQFAIVDALPLTPNGKVDRSRLEPPTVAAETPREHRAPTDRIERELVAIWEDVLGVSSIGITDNFFELGGHSLLAIRMMDRIARALGASLPIALLFQAPTIEALAAAVRDAEEAGPSAATWETVVPIQRGGDRPPFFCVHDGAGGVFHFNYLARQLGDDQPFYGLQPHAWDYGRAETPSIEGLATHYVEQIRKVQHDGPYLIGGFCFGGIVALEVAQQLRANGEEVGVLALIEPSRITNPHAPPDPALANPLDGGAPPRGRAAKLKAKVKSKLVHKQGAELIDPAKVGTYRSPPEIIKLVAIVAVIRTKRLICQAFLRAGRPIPRRLRNFYFKDQVSRKAGVRYTAKPYDGSIDLFLARRHGLDWQGLAARGLAVHHVAPDESGYVPDHLTMLRDPWITQVAEPLRAAIDHAVDPESTSHR